MQLVVFGCFTVVVEHSEHFVGFDALRGYIPFEQQFFELVVDDSLFFFWSIFAYGSEVDGKVFGAGIE
jgi:hypothetical protein